MDPVWLVVGSVVGTVGIVFAAYAAGVRAERRAAVAMVAVRDQRLEFLGQRLANADDRIRELAAQGDAGAAACAEIIAAERALADAAPDPRGAVNWGVLRWGAGPAAASRGDDLAAPPSGPAGGDELGGPREGGGVGGHDPDGRVPPLD